MKRIFLIMIGLGLFVQSGFASQEPMAVLYRTDGRNALRVFLIDNQDDEVVVRLEEARANSRIAYSDIERLEFAHPAFDETQLKSAFNQVDYASVIKTLEPFTKAAGEYMAIPNNLEKEFALLMKAYFENGDLNQAEESAKQLLAVQNEKLKSVAQAYYALAILGNGDVDGATARLKKQSDPVASLYIQASIERAQGDPQAAIQTAVDLIALYPNNMDWMPQTELLCAEVYLDLGMTNSAASTARQTQQLYAGLNVEKKAEALRSAINESTEQPEE